MNQTDEHRLKTHAFMPIQLDAYIGIYEYERLGAQELIISGQAQFYACSLNEHQREALFYSTLHEYCKTHKPLLLERMVYELALLIAEKIPGITELSLMIDKPLALKDAKGSFVKLVLKN